MASNDGMAYSGSHRVTEQGSKVVVHDLELFCGHDPKIDTGTDTEIKAFTPAKVKEAYDRTMQFYARGQRTQVVVRHDKPGRVVEPGSFGNIATMRFDERDGVGRIFGDVEMGKKDFENLILSNRYPRRSGEISREDGHMAQVALLGREAPRRPLADTRFERDDRFDSFETRSETAFEPKETNMDSPETLAKISLLEAKLATYEADAAKDKTLLAERDTAFATLIAERTNDQSRIAALEATARDNEVKSILAEMERDRYVFSKDAKDLAAKTLAASSNRAETEKLLRLMGQKMPASGPLPSVLHAERPTSAVGAGAGGISPLTVIECQQGAIDPKTGEYDPAKFKLLMEAAAGLVTA